MIGRSPAGTKRLPPLPSFIVIGAQKSATRWLRLNLGRLPDVFVAGHEIKYFNHASRVDALGTEWYRSQFTGWSGEPVVGEATPGYMMLGHGPADVAERIAATVPQVRLIALLRNPVDRTVSAFVHHQRQHRIHPCAGVLPTVRSCRPEDDWMGLVAGGWYAASLEPFIDRFGEQLLVLVHDDIALDAREVFGRAVRHVGAAPDVVPDALDEVVFSNRGAHRTVPQISASERCELFEYFRADVERLERLLGRDLSRWRPDASTS